MNDDESHHADQLTFLHQAEEALKAATSRPLTLEEQAAIAWAARIQLFPRKKNETDGQRR